MDLNSKQDKELVDTLLDAYEIHHKQKPLFRDYLVKCAEYLRSDYNYLINDFFHEVNTASLEEAFASWQTNVEPVDLIDDFFLAEQTSMRKKTLENFLRKPNRINSLDKTNTNF